MHCSRTALLAHVLLNAARTFLPDQSDCLENPTDFQANGATLAPDDYEVIDELAKLIRTAEQARTNSGRYTLKVIVDGHADTGRRPEAKPPALQDLCLERAIAVRNRLEIKGVDRRWIEAKGSGATGINPLTNEPVQENYNKRVYFSCIATPRARSPHSRSPVGRPPEPPSQAAMLQQENLQLQEEKQQLQRQLARLSKMAALPAPLPEPEPERAPANRAGCCALVPTAGPLVPLLHGVTELAWIVAVLLCGKTIFASLLTRASLESADECPRVEVRINYSPTQTPSPFSDDDCGCLQDCGQITNYFFVCSIATSLLAVFGVLWMALSRRCCRTSTAVGTVNSRPTVREMTDGSDAQSSPNVCYISGCFLGLLLLAAQIVELVLPFASIPIIPARSQPLGRRQLVGNASFYSLAGHGSSVAHSPQRQLQVRVRTGFCADNDDWETEPDIICPKPTWLNRHALGRTEGQCCDCSSTTLELPLAFCVNTVNLESRDVTDYERDDVCSAVMRYSKCGLPRLPSGMIDEQSINDCAHEERNQGYPGGPLNWATANTELQQKCRRCYEPSFRQGSFAELAKAHPETMQSLCTRADNQRSLMCTYEFQLLTELERCDAKFCSSSTDASGVAVGNSVYLEGNLESQPVVANVTCESPASLRGQLIEGRTPEECCETVGMCIGNTDPHAEPNVTCDVGAGLALKPDALHIRGRGTEACCYKTGRCVGNTDGMVEPDVVCPSPSMLKPAVTIGRDAETCCYTTGMCSGNSDSVEDVDCEALGLVGRTLRSNSDGISRGDDSRQCCECRSSNSSSLQVARPDAWCVRSTAIGTNATSVSDHLQSVVTAADDQCTQVMKYAKCPQLVDFCKSCVAYCEECEACAENFPYPTWQTVADDSQGQDRCMEGDRGENATNRYECTFVIRHFEEQQGQETCVDNMCIGNTDPEIDPDVTCSNGLQLLPDAEHAVGRTEEECCVVTGRCAGNTDSQAEPDIQCPSPSRLTDEVGAIGRNEPSCCITSGMCVGNSLSAGQPDVVCPPNWRAKQGSELIAGRSIAFCCERVGYCADNDAPDVDDVACPAPAHLVANAERTVGRTAEACCVRTGLCTGNMDPFAEPDIVCSAPAVLRSGAGNRIGRNADANGPCCEVTGMCAGNSDTENEPDVVCSGAWTLVDDAIRVSRGSLDEQGWRCCHTACPTGDQTPVCRCGDISAEAMVPTTGGQVFVLALISVLLGILRVSAAHRAFLGVARIGLVR